MLPAIFQAIDFWVGFLFPLSADSLAFSLSVAIFSRPRNGSRRVAWFAISINRPIFAMREVTNGLLHVAFRTDLYASFSVNFAVFPSHSSDYIITRSHSNGFRALVGRLFFRHCLVVAPSAPLGLSPYMCGLAQDCHAASQLRKVSPEFTRLFDGAYAAKGAIDPRYHCASCLLICKV